MRRFVTRNSSVSILIFVVCRGVAHGKCRSIAGHCQGTNAMPDSSRPTPTPQPTPTQPTQPDPQPVVKQPTQPVTPQKPDQRFAKAAFDFPPENERELELKVCDTFFSFNLPKSFFFG